MIPLIRLIESEIEKIKEEDSEKFVKLRMAIGNCIPRDAKILEIGAGFGSVFNRKIFKNLKVLDYYSTEELFLHFKEDMNIKNKTMDDFSTVDFICKDGNLLNAIDGEKFDVIYSSHSLEHHPNTIYLLQSLSAALNEGGIVIFIVPDKRATFDALRNTTTTGELLYSYKENKTIPSPSMVFDYYSHVVNENYLSEVKSDNDINFAHDLNYALDMFNKYYNGCSEYVDIHNFAFTPESFCINIIELYMMKIIDLLCSYCSDSYNYEFVSILNREPHQTDENKNIVINQILSSMRMDLYKKSLAKH